MVEDEAADNFVSHNTVIIITIRQKRSSHWKWSLIGRMLYGYNEEQIEFLFRIDERCDVNWPPFALSEDDNNNDYYRYFVLGQDSVGAFNAARI